MAALLDPEAAVSGVTTGSIRPELRRIAVISATSGGHLNPEGGDLKVTAGWGHAGQSGVTMPGKGKLVERAYASDEDAATTTGAKGPDFTAEQARALLGESTCDVYLNGAAYWKNVPSTVWGYTLGGYQVIKKWLSYREHKILGRSLTSDEAREVTNIARRIAAILLLTPALDGNYESVKRDTSRRPV